MTEYTGILKTSSEGLIHLLNIQDLKLKLKNNDTNVILPDRPEIGSGSRMIISEISRRDASTLSIVCKSSDHFADFYIFKDGILISVVESCILQDLEINTSLVSGIIEASFRLGIGGSRAPTRKERIKHGINRLKKEYL